MMILLFAILFAGVRHNSDTLKELLPLIGIRQLGCPVDPRRKIAWGNKSMHFITGLLCGLWERIAADDAATLRVSAAAGNTGTSMQG